VSYVEILILRRLRSGPAHGYELRKRVEQTTGVVLHNNSLYPALKRFEEAGAIEGELVPQRGVPPRRVFRLTESGHDLLRSLLEDFPQDLADSDEEFLTRLAFFHLIAPEARREILARRRRALLGRIAHLDEMAKLAAVDPEEPYAQRLLDFQRRQAENEVAWVAELAAEEEAS